ncbi:ABC-2 family transporter protein, partial [Patescibacteria group bacterium]|nr:ABC-2 family transporter protein [Patescibacteria group bacterium]
FFLILKILTSSRFNLIVLILFSILSYLVMSLINIIVGLTSFIIEENDGIFYITSKLFLIFGNQIIPIALMPDWAIKLAQITPFYFGLSAPVEVAFGRLAVLKGLLVAVFYIIFLYSISQFMLVKLKRKLILNG